MLACLRSWEFFYLIIFLSHLITLVHTFSEIDFLLFNFRFIFITASASIIIVIITQSLPIIIFHSSWRAKRPRAVPTRGKEEIQSAKSNRNKISSSFGRTNDVALWDESKVLPHSLSSEPAHCLPLTYLCSFFKQTLLSFYSLPLCVSILSFFISIVVVSLCVCTVISYMLVRVWLLLHNIYYYFLFHFVRVYGKRWYTQVLLLTFSHRHMHICMRL